MKYIINISDFNEITKGIKALKSDLVCYNGNSLIGTDNTRTNLKITTIYPSIDIAFNIPPFTIITKELSSKFFANITDTTVVIDLDINKIYCPNNMSWVEDANPMITDNNITQEIRNMEYRRFQELQVSLSNKNNFIHFDEITEDPGFQYIKSLKTENGARLYYPKGNKIYGMYLYNNAVPTVKGDKVYLDIIDHGNTFTAQFIVEGKKKNSVSIYYRFVKL